jgi:hypothetical protein
VATEDFFINVLGEGSFSLGLDCPTWRGPTSHRITAEQAERCLAYKEANPDANLFIISTEPLDEHGKPSWQLRPQDLAWNVVPTVEPDDVDMPTESPDEDEYEPAPDEYACEVCGKPFLSLPGLRQHMMLNHARAHEDAERDARILLAATRAARAAQRRVEESPPEDLHPVERPPSEPPRSYEPVRPALWPPLPEAP